MAELKTTKTDASVAEFIDDDTKREACRTLSIGALHEEEVSLAATVQTSA